MIVAADWVTISALATAGGTLVLALATFASVRSANRAARVAEHTLLTGLRPLLIPSRLEDAPQKVGFADEKFLLVKGSGGAAETTPEAVYLAMSLRNAGAGVALLHGWCFYPEGRLGDGSMPPLESFTRLTRDIYVPARDAGFWQGAFRDSTAPEFATATEVVRARRPFVIDILYGDHEGGQRTISRFSWMPRGDDDWIVAAARYWNVDRADPR